ncbi:MAG: nicotinate phosphoribosyltransferase [Spirochaetales bacterium]|nr:nicotinate phosphoribosyltransferase [Spirochaetales bacterium]
MYHSQEHMTPMLSDLYQVTMCYGYYLSGIIGKTAVFDLFFRNNPFKGSYTVFAGLQDVLDFLENFRFTDDDIAYIRESLLPQADEGFFKWLKEVDASVVRLSAMEEGAIVFPREPLIRVEGPLGVCQLLETTLLNLVNFPSLIATNAARMRIAAGFDKTMLEFGLRRAQGPDGGLSASRFSYLGGFDGTSSMLAGKLFNLPVKGTHAHAFVQAFHGLEDLRNLPGLKDAKGKEVDFKALVLATAEEAGIYNTNQGELAAFIAYASAFPDNFLALVDTYDTLRSGVPNFITVAGALKKLGHEPVGIRLDSGDLAYLSRETRKLFTKYGQRLNLDFSGVRIAASNDINEEVLLSLNHQGHEIDIFGVGTHLVTCQAQPALGCVYKLVEIEGSPRIKLSQQVVKITIPGCKDCYRLYGKDDAPLADLMIMVGEDVPEKGERILCHHPFDETKRVYIVPSRVEKLNHLVWKGARMIESVSLHQQRKRLMDQLKIMRDDYARPVNPAQYKVSVTETLFKFLHELWSSEAPIEEIL